MADNAFLQALHSGVLHLPLVTTCFATFFAIHLFSRYRTKAPGTGHHLLWWGIGCVTYAVGTATESLTTLVGWHPVVFRFWYVAGAFLGGYPLAQGSIYLLMKKRFADVSAVVASTVIVIASIFVFLSPLDPSLAEVHRLSGKVMVWSWVRMISPFLNLYSVAFLVGGAIHSAIRFKRSPRARNRYLGNILIAIGAILPGFGGAATRFGVVEALYVTELLGLFLIFLGYRTCQKPAEAVSPAVVEAGEAVAAG